MARRRPPQDQARRVTPQARENASPDSIRKIALERLRKVKQDIAGSSVLETMGVMPKERSNQWAKFEEKMRRVLKRADLDELERGDEEMARLVSSLMRAWKDRGFKGLDQQLENAFLGYVASSRSFSKDDYQNQRALADLRYPTEWYPATRKMQRKIIMHVGPTNSGKTYHALKRLEEAKSGAYAGPLRLLAHEVYTRMNAKGATCSLITGEERRRPEGVERAALLACTVEMIPLHTEMDVCVIDEIQLIGDIERGWAWTQALLGVQAKEVHLCGEARTVPLIRELAASMGDEVEVHTYERLTPLKMDKRHMGYNFKELRKGDCIVAFSVIEIHGLRQEIQKQTGKKVAIVYGSLPPETRAQQARLFNDPDSGYDILVASDAIGMGLNLSIKRVIFASVTKFNGFEEVPLTIPHLKQIAGRAGRYKSAHDANQEAERASKGSDTSDIPVTTLDAIASQSHSSAKFAGAGGAEHEPFEFADPEPGGGLVTTIEKADMTFVRKGLFAEPEPLRTAGLFPPDPIVERFANYFPPGTPFSYILLRLHDISRLHKRFHMCLLKDQLNLVDAIQGVEGLSVLDRITFCAAPATIKSPKDRQILFNLAKCVAEQKNGNLLDIEGFDWSLLDRPTTANRTYLHSLESLHKAIVLYLWLSYRFSGVFSTRALAFHAKSLVEQAIEATLTEFTRTHHQSTRRIKQRQRVRELELKEFQDDLQAARERESQDAQNEGGEKVTSEGSRYEQADILDGAEEDQEVDPVDVRDETVHGFAADEETRSPDLANEAKLRLVEAEEGDELEMAHGQHPPVLDAEEVASLLADLGDLQNTQEKSTNTNTGRDA
ncbi:RNA helicase [Neofusicoccum ribis]|uniref:RNA helicase n=1 Tax=Neofusicoccum ribis TaxID=45134 RepID=A0ABR3TFG6_9PEZI